MINLETQVLFDDLSFDPERGYALLSERDQKIRHIHLHVAKAAMKLASNDERRIVEEVIPDTAIYRSQLINIVGARNFFDYPANFPEKLEYFAPPEDRRRHALEKLAIAGGNLATYIEKKEHGGYANRNYLAIAAIDLHEVATNLGDIYEVEVDSSHRRRLETLSGRPLPSDITVHNTGEK